MPNWSQIIYFFVLAAALFLLAGCADMAYEPAQSNEVLWCYVKNQADGKSVLTVVFQNRSDQAADVAFGPTNESVVLLNLTEEGKAVRRTEYGEEIQLAAETFFGLTADHLVDGSVMATHVPARGTATREFRLNELFHLHQRGVYLVTVRRIGNNLQGRRFMYGTSTTFTTPGE